jgi:hypothetical protein
MRDFEWRLVSKIVAREAGICTDAPALTRASFAIKRLATRLALALTPARLLGHYCDEVPS